MKSRQFGFSFSGFTWFFLVVLLFLAIIGVRKYSAHKSNPKQISLKFQKDLASAESKTKSRVEFLSSNLFSNKWDSGLAGLNFPDGEESEGKVSLFVFKNDSLVYWNDNTEILPATINKSGDRTYFASRLKNGWYGFYCQRIGDFCFIGSYLIKAEYPFQNEFLKTHFSTRFDLPVSVNIEREAGFHPIYAKDKTFLFSLNFSKYNVNDQGQEDVILLLFILGSLSLFYLIFLVISQAGWFHNRDRLAVIIYMAAIVLLRLTQYSLGFPAEIFRMELFSPAWYSSSVFLPSLGDFLLNSLLVLTGSMVFYKMIKAPAGPLASPKIIRVAWISILLFIMLALFQAVGYFTGDLVINSPLSLNLQNISGLTPESVYGLIIVAALFFSLWLVSSRIFDFIFSLVSQVKWVVFSTVLVIFMYASIGWVSGVDTHYPVMVFFMAYVVSYGYIKRKNQTSLSIQSLLFLLCFYAVFATFLLNSYNQIKESEKIKLLAGKIVSQRNPVTEALYEQVEKRVYADSLMNHWLSSEYVDKLVSQDSLGNYLKTHYFKDYWNKYQIQVTCCSPTKELSIQPKGYLINCQKYFGEVIENYGKATQLQGFWFLDYEYGKEYYLAIISGKTSKNDQEQKPLVFIEFNLKNVYLDPGYPGLLMDQARMELPNLSDYSYGLYQNGRLVRAVGTNGYKIELGKYSSFSPLRPFFKESRMVHFQFRINEKVVVLISKRENDLLSYIAPFSYLFMMFSAFSLLFIGMVSFPNMHNPFPDSLRNKLHFTLIGILLITMVAIGLVQILNIIQISSKKNVDNLRERAYSVVTEVQHKYSNLERIEAGRAGGLEDFLIKLSNVFFSDINIYNDRGVLVATSRPQIFEEGLLSKRMNAIAYQQLVVEKDAKFIHHESIGNMQFNSAYLPFYNEQGGLLGFVNLPYFARQDESKKEISSFLVTFLNVYILLIFFGIFVTILISNYITAPLTILAKKMSQIRLGKVNEKILWQQKDEIGQLVSQYNMMIDELGSSAALLAKSERESAWREMARQVAHEIKNPLTPMKLSAQYLEKAWKEKAPDWDQRFSRFTQTLVEQIDALSVIASDFSDFAKMQTVTMAPTNVDEVIRFVLSLFQDTTRIRYSYRSEVLNPMVMGDRSQLIRLFTNLLNNAVQAIGEHEGVIGIEVTDEQRQFVIAISDDGCGIPSNRTEKIFQPDFTTKTSGMGLGLAIVKGIVDGMNGEISFQSEEKRGTKFIIKFQKNG